MFFGGNHNNRNSNNHPKLKMTYFDARGRGELSRFILAYAGRDFEDNRIQFSEWPALKPKTPCGGLPLLNVDGTIIAQSVAIARYLARECKLDGKSSLEKAQADMIVDCVTDAFLAYIPDKQGKPNNFKAEVLPNFLIMMEKFLKSNGGKYFVGKETTWADIALAALFDDLVLKHGENEIFGDNKCLKDHFHCVMKHPNIKKWVKKRPKTAL